MGLLRGTERNRFRGTELLSGVGNEVRERVKKCAAFQQMDLRSDLLQFSESLSSPIFSISTFYSHSSLSTIFPSRGYFNSGFFFLFIKHIS